MTRAAYKYETEVGTDGKLELKVPLAEGVRVEVVVLGPETDQFGDYLQAAQSSVDFWDNPVDDAEWNDV